MQKYIAPLFPETGKRHRRIALGLLLIVVFTDWAIRDLCGGTIEASVRIHAGALGFGIILEQIS